MVIDLLKQQWKTMLENRNIAPDYREQAFSDIVKSYTARGRHYHNLEHLQELFRHSDRYQFQLKDKDVVAAAIFFHDVIYNPARRDNEVKSAEFAARNLPMLGFMPEEIQMVYEFIVATQQHELPDHPHPDLPWFLDFDLAILGADWETYLNYTKNIRLEYRIYPDLLYKPGRRKAMEQFLMRPKIYFTEKFQDMFETMARRNISMEINMLIT